MHKKQQPFSLLLLPNLYPVLQWELPDPQLEHQLVLPRPMVGTPVGAPKTSTPVSATAAKPTVSTPASPAVASVSKPGAPAKPPESKTEISRRNFIKGLAILGGIVAVGEFAALGPYLQGSVGQSSISSQVLEDSSTGATLHNDQFKFVFANSWTTFVYPRTGNPNIDNDTFRQAVIIHCQRGGMLDHTAQLTRSRATLSLR